MRVRKVRSPVAASLEQVGSAFCSSGRHKHHGAMRVLLVALATVGARPTRLRLRGGADAIAKPRPPAAQLTPLEEQLLDKVRVYARGLDLDHVIPEKVVKKALAGAAALDYETVEATLAENAAYAATEHPDYGKLAARLAVDRLHASTTSSFKETLLGLNEEPNPTTHEPCHILDDGLRIALESDMNFVAQVEGALKQERDFEGFDYFGYKTLEKSYLLRHRGGVFGSGVAERPQHLLMRVALGIHRGWETSEQLERALETYDLMSRGYFIHASPTLFHAGLQKAHMSSCFLLGSIGDSIEGIYKSLGECARISKAAGGIGLSVADVRAAGSTIKGTGGESNGLVPMLRVFDATARYVDQGGGKRPGAFAAYVEPWHADIFDVLDLKKNHGKEERRARDLFYGLWVPDLFMRRVKEDADWALMCPDECPGLTDHCGDAFDNLYETYEAQGQFKRKVKARKLWRAILDAQMETGTPYMLYKDACNKKSNQQHLGPIKCSNLCCEIVEFADENEIAVCNLASLVLPKFVENGTVDFDALKRVAKVVAMNLDATIDSGTYPNAMAERSNLRHRPIGIGVQGLANFYALLRIPFDSAEAAKLNEDIFEAIYVGALEASIELAKKHGPHASYQGSPASRGDLQPDLWGLDAKELDAKSRWDWATLRADLARYGLRNSLLTAPMPTASTAQIMGCNECFEPYTSNLYARRVKAGEFVVANRHLVKDLCERGLWDDDLRRALLGAQGSVQGISRVPDDIKALYKTAWELSQKSLLDLSAGRGPFVDQSQSLNCFIAAPDYGKLTTFHFRGWEAGLKTGMYYLRTRPAADAIQFTLDAAAAPAAPDAPTTIDDGRGEDIEACISCSG